MVRQIFPFLFSYVPMVLTEYVWRYARAFGDGERYESDQKLDSWGFISSIAKAGPKKVSAFLITPLKNCIFQKKICIDRTTFSPFFGILLLQGTFPRVQILLQLKSPIIVRGTCNTGYSDGHNTQN